MRGHLGLQASIPLCWCCSAGRVGGTLWKQVMGARCVGECGHQPQPCCLPPCKALFNAKRGWSHWVLWPLHTQHATVIHPAVIISAKKINRAVWKKIIKDHLFLQELIIKSKTVWCSVQFTSTMLAMLPPVFSWTCFYKHSFCRGWGWHRAFECVWEGRVNFCIYDCEYMLLCPTGLKDIV